MSDDEDLQQFLGFDLNDLMVNAFQPINHAPIMDAVGDLADHLLGLAERQRRFIRKFFRAVLIQVHFTNLIKRIARVNQVLGKRKRR